MAQPLRLGAFDALAPLARGGMGAVYRGVHREQRVPVAIKVIAGDRRSTPAARQALREEVRAMARLDHPAIVRVLDHGEVGPVPPGGALAPGDLYIVMELAGGGSLARQLPEDFDGAADLLDTLLGGLAHAHAHGVVHRDLKPENVLLAGPHDLRPGPKLTDFGIAYATVERYGDIAPNSTGEGIAGTPLFMAPEQVQGSWRDFGPWTDLYALGCLSWVLFTGDAPFRGESLVDIARQHVFDTPPRLKTRFPVPDGLEDWLLRLLRKGCNARFQAAAHARAELRTLRGVAPVTPFALPPEADSDLDLETKTAEMLRPPPGSTAWSTGWSAEDARPVRGSMAAAEGLADPDAPPRPDGLPPWKAQRATADLALSGAGLGLFGLRPAPMTGRHAERDRLWGLLETTRTTLRPAVGLLVGPAGVGKSRLASWLGARAHELGAATVLHAHHSAGGGPGEGKVAMLARHLRCFGLGGGRLERRLSALLPGDTADVEEAREVLRRLFDEDETEPLGIEDRHAAVRFVLSRLAQGGPVVVVFEDAQWRPDALRFVASTLLGGREAGPILFLVTVRDDLLVELPEAAVLVDALADSAERIELGPLDPDDSRAMIDGMLGFQGGLADALVQRTAGNPQFAVQLVADWVERDLIELGTDGFRLRPGSEPALPPDLEAAWAERLERFLLRQPSAADLALERAAVLGHTVVRAEWQELMKGEAVDLQALEDRLLTERLAIPAETGWSFAHAMLREAVLQRTRDRGRGRLHHVLVAAMLLRAPRQGGDHDERLGRHLLASGQGERAAEPLLKAAHERHQRGEIQAALRLLDLRLEGLGNAITPRQRLDGLATRVHVLIAMGALDASVQAGRAMAELAGSLGEPGLRCDALLAQAESRTQRGEGPAAEEQAREALDIATRLDDPARIARTHTLLAHIADREGDWARAETHLRESLRQNERTGDPSRRAGTLRVLGRALGVQGHHAEALELTHEALELSRGPGGRLSRAHCLNALGEYARATGQAARAEVYYRSAARAYTGLGSNLAIFPLYNLGLLLTREGRFDEAWFVLTATAQQCRSTGQRGMLAACEPALLAVAAGRGDWESFDRHEARAREQFAPLGFSDPDFVQAAETAAELAFEAGQDFRARKARELGAWLGGLGEG